MAGLIKYHLVDKNNKIIKFTYNNILCPEEILIYSAFLIDKNIEYLDYKYFGNTTCLYMRRV